jgi:hypothetical protein
MLTTIFGSSAQQQVALTSHFSDGQKRAEFMPTVAAAQYRLVVVDVRRKVLLKFPL